MSTQKLAAEASQTADCLARARGLVPLLDAAAPRIEAARELTGDVLDALHRAELFRLLIPRSLGGAELEPWKFVEAIETVAKGDASSAWCLCQNSGCSMSAAYLRPEVAAEVFGDARAVLAWGAGAVGTAHAVDGGYRVGGTWQFASGSRHVTWLGGHCLVVEKDGTPRLAADGTRVERTMLFPRARASIRDVWHVVGLKGTGSDTYSVADLFVPDAYTLDRFNALERREPGRLYRFTSSQLYASGFAGVALGVARATLDAFVDLARNKRPRGAGTTLRDNAVAQSEVGLAEARLRSARTYVLQTLREIWETLSGQDELTLDQRMAVRLAATFAIQEARDVVDMAYHAAGSTGILESGPFERRFRDVHAVCQQVQGRRSHFETVGQHLLGLEADLLFV
jgi:alkylation response protein AidB-like acyl-CoA dehydrogenase